jgi:hypothetical protein
MPVKPPLLRVSFLGILLGLSGLAQAPQPWDAASQAIGWARQDRDDSFTFYDEAAAALQTWARDGGLLRTTPLGKLGRPPEKWAIDPRGNPWVVAGPTLFQVGRNGQTLDTFRLPTDVADLGWDASGMVLSYRAVEPYLEKRDFKGRVLWTHGTKPSRSEGPPPMNQHPILVDDTGSVLLASGASLNLTVLNGANGKVQQETTFHLPDGRPAPPLEGSGEVRGPMVLWPGKEVVFAAVKSLQVPAAQRESSHGLSLARLDLRRGQVEFLPTGLNESHLLVGMADSEALFVSPSGGLVQVKVR